MKKIALFLSLNNKTKWIFIEAFFYLALGRIMKELPFKKVAPSFGRHMKESPFELEGVNVKKAKQVSQAIHIMSRYTFWESQCLVKAIAGMKMMKRRKIETTLYLGTAKDEEGKMIAHAWLRSGSIYITGYEEMKRFTVVGTFQNKAH
ncbi:lasso peptide biosynthesis B2 protein [Bacillus spongiae]|uniref:Lasso peptide biosynthesis B2 protein n=1 Tax=Bacillus spongiae TaxID=2683610 RepID=A0ABU8HEK2_9BACI